jgi:membrane fusion protein (multidrug efflux system)
MTDADQTPPASQGSPARRRGFIALTALVVLGCIGWGVYWLLFLRHYQSTDDAYVSGDIVQITSEIAGTVTRVSADDTQSVEQGQLLVELDPADAAVAIASAEAELARAVRNVGALFAQQAQLRSQLAARAIALARSETDVARRQNLVQDGAVSVEELAHANQTIAAQRAELAAAQEQLNGIKAQTQGTTVATHPEVLHAAANVHTAALAMRRTRLTAPLAGVVAQRTVHVGEHVSAGMPLMAVVALADVWIDANFKESQLTRMRVGQPVTVQTDVYGNDVVLHGKVAGLSAGSGSAFAVLPAQNASGNWIKIVQRVPVRIALDPADVAKHPLRIGLSMRVRVDVADSSGPVVAKEVRATPHAAQASEGDDPAVNARIASIIADNSVASTSAPALQEQ